MSSAVVSGVLAILAEHPGEELLTRDLVAAGPSWKDPWVRDRLRLLVNLDLVAVRAEGKYRRYRLTEAGRVLASRPEIRGLVYEGPQSRIALTRNLVRVFGVALERDPVPFWDQMLRNRLGVASNWWHWTQQNLVLNGLIARERILPPRAQTHPGTCIYYTLTPTGVHLARLCTEGLPVEVFPSSGRGKRAREGSNPEPAA